MYACSSVTGPDATIPIPSTTTPFRFERSAAIVAAGSAPNASFRTNGMSWRKVRVSVSSGTSAEAPAGARRTRNSGKGREGSAASTPRHDRRDRTPAARRDRPAAPASTIASSFAAKPIRPGAAERSRDSFPAYFSIRFLTVASREIRRP